MLLTRERHFEDRAVTVRSSLLRRAIEGVLVEDDAARVASGYLVSR